MRAVHVIQVKGIKAGGARLASGNSWGVGQRVFDIQCTLGREDSGEI